MPFFDFRVFRNSAFFPVPLRYRSRTWLKRFSKSSDSDPGWGVGVGSEESSEGGESGSVALVVKEKTGLGAWGLGEEDASGNRFGSCREDDGIVGMFMSCTVLCSLTVFSFF
ncbi:hypothetical protein PanWU01x14_043270, partial [Parasponia andersonii]